MSNEIIDRLKKATVINNKVDDFEINKLIYSINGQLLEIVGKVYYGNNWYQAKWDNFGDGSVKLPLTKKDIEEINKDIVLIGKKLRITSYGRNKQIEKLHTIIESGYDNVDIGLHVIEDFPNKLADNNGNT